MSGVFAPQEGSNAVMRTAWDAGYDYLHFGTNVLGLTECPPHPRVICLTPRRASVSTWAIEILDAINRMTPLSYFVSVNSSAAKATTVRDVADAVRSRPLTRPQVLFAHTLQPHSPYTRNADCSLRQQVSLTLSGPGDEKGYVEAVQCVNRMMLEFADVAAAKDPGAIVIFSSDHGTKFTLDQAAYQGNWTKRQFDERFGALLAIRAPERCVTDLKDDMTLVNIYRWAFACAEGKPPVLLDNRFYDAGYDAFGGERVVRRFPDNGPPA
jgi:hypothetical protein